MYNVLSAIDEGSIRDVLELVVKCCKGSDSRTHAAVWLPLSLVIYRVGVEIHEYVMKKVPATYLLE